MGRSRCACTLFVAFLTATSALGDGLFRNIYHGLDLFVTPTGSPVITNVDGFRTNGARSGRVRVVPNRLGDGYRLELDRIFGVDNSGRPEIFDAGPYQMELDGGIQSTLGFTRRNFATNAHDHSNPFFIGNGQLLINSLNYTIRETSGIQDITLTGTLNGTGEIEVNQLGFYTLSLDVNNTNSQLSMDGVVVDGTTDTDYTIGPINVKGNVFVDGVITVLASLGLDTTKLEQVFPNSPVDQVTRSIREALGAQLETDAAKVSTSLATGAGPLYATSLTSPTLLGLQTATTDIANQGPSSVPEPASLLLLVLGGGLTVRAMRRT